MDKKPTSAVAEPSRRSSKAKRFADEFKRDAVRLVSEERYTFKAAAAAVGVSVLNQSEMEILGRSG
jgi:transposase-like protein